jgi:hypothetical protein
MIIIITNQNNLYNNNLDNYFASDDNSKGRSAFQQRFFLSFRTVQVDHRYGTLLLVYCTVGRNTDSVLRTRIILRKMLGESTIILRYDYSTDGTCTVLYSVQLQYRKYGSAPP